MYRVSVMPPFPDLFALEWRIPYIHGDRTLHLAHPPHNAAWYVQYSGRMNTVYTVGQANPLGVELCPECLFSVAAGLAWVP